MEFIAVTTLIVLMNISFVDITTDPVPSVQQQPGGTIIIESVPGTALWSTTNDPTTAVESPNT